MTLKGSDLLDNRDIGFNDLENENSVVNTINLPPLSTMKSL